MQTAKHILTTPDPYVALLAYHETKHSTTGFSPAQLSMGRSLRTTIPTIKFNLQPKVPNRESVLEYDEKAKQIYKSYYDQRHGTRPLPELFPGDKVNIKQDSEKKGVIPGIVEGKAETPRSYIVKTSKESLRRNRKHLQMVPHYPVSHDQQAGEGQSLPLEEAHDDIGSVSPKNDVPGSVTSRYGRVIKPVVKMNL